MHLALGSVNICMKKAASAELLEPFLLCVTDDGAEPIALAFCSTHITFGGRGSLLGAGEQAPDIVQVACHCNLLC